MKYTTVEKVQKFLDEKYGVNTCWAFGTTGIIPPKPDYIKDIKNGDIKVAPFGSWTNEMYGKNSSVFYFAIDYYSTIEADFSDFNDFIEPPSEDKVIKCS
jgi:hypothetical protein